MNASHVLNQTFAGATCQSVTDSSPINNTLHLSLPFVCDGVEYGDRTWRGVLCFPFWQYGAAEMLVVFCLLLWWRKYSRAKAISWRGQTIPEILGSQGSLGSSTKSLEKPLLKKDKVPRRKSTQETLGSGLAKLSHAATNMTKEGLKRLFVATLHILAQTFQWWFLLTLLLIGLFLSELQHIKDVYISKLSPTYFLGHMFYGLPMVQPDVFLQAEQKMPDYLWKFSVYSIVALILIYMVCIVCIFFQAMTHLTSTFIENPCDCFKGGWQDGRAMMSSPRDVAVSVLLLPMVYGFLALRSVICMWSSVTGLYSPALTCDHWQGNHWSGMKLVPTGSNMTRGMLDEVYESNFALADVYESFSLYMFAIMLGSMLEPGLKTALKSYAIKAFADILVTPVFLFVAVLGLNATWTIFMAWTKWRLGIDMCEVAPSLCLFAPYYEGANWCVSSIALYNLISIETKFHTWPVMKEFGPFYKFAAIKAMVTVSFSSPIILGVAKNVFKLGLDDSQTKLLDSSFRIYVMALVALVNVVAWWPWMNWYGRVAGDASPDKAHHDSDDYLIADKVPSGTISLVQELLRFKEDLTEEQAEDFMKVAEIIDELEETELLRVLYHGSQIGWGVQSQHCVKSMKPGKPGKPSSEVKGSSSRKTWLWGRSSDADDESHPKALFHCTTDEKKECLKYHLRSFYPASDIEV